MMRIITLLVLAYTSVLVILPPLEPFMWEALLAYDEYAFLLIPMVVSIELLAAWTGYVLSDKIGHKIMKRFYKQKKVDDSENKLSKWGWTGFFLFAATPLPFTVAVYYAGAVKYDKIKFFTALAAGRTFKYATYLVAIYLLGWKYDTVKNFIFELLGL